MQFVYDLNASQEILCVKEENYRYLFKVRRLRVGDSVNFRNLKDDILYSYEIVEVNKKEGLLKLLDHERSENIYKNFHIMWCVIDPKVIYVTLPMLNQLGVSKISFIYCDRSQKNFKIDLQKIQKILINSSQQCGRVDIMDIEIIENFESMLEYYKEFAVLDFGGDKECGDIKSVLIGCEGGFSEDERRKLKNNRKVGLDTDLILRSETAIVAISSKVLI
jgi:16S rRNA (uracil1498-N3)-methyltransferase